MKKIKEKAVNVESLSERADRLADEAKAGGDLESHILYCMLWEIMMTRFSEQAKETALIMLLNRKLAD